MAASQPCTAKSDGASIADLSAMRGIIEYQPSEYTVTARAGTPVCELAAALREQGQYLPFDPLLPEQATIGGTVAGNLSASRRHRYGGARDFILGAAVVDGLGRAFRVGGKVVKNSAGFDLSKFLVGSLGHYAIMTELTFKIFPDAPRFSSLSFSSGRLEDALAAIYFINQSVYELDALDLMPPRSPAPDERREERRRLETFGALGRLPQDPARAHQALLRGDGSRDGARSY